MYTTNDNRIKDDANRVLDDSTSDSFSIPSFPKILIIGVGGAGNNCIDQITAHDINGVRTIAINTDIQQLNSVHADTKLLIGTRLANGMGVGGDPKLGRKCAIESRELIDKLFGDVELTFLVTGMGGGTGTGATPIIAEIARSHGSVVMGLATTPFRFECGRKLKAKVGLRSLSAAAHSMLVIDNNKLLKLAPELPLDQAFKKIDNLISDIISGLTETMTSPSLINLDFADIKTIMRKGELALMFYGESTTLDPDEIVKKTFNNPLLNLDYNQANGALIHITGGSQLSLQLTNDITKNITKKLKPKANVILGARVNPEYEDKVKLLTIMTGIRPSKTNLPFNEAPFGNDITNLMGR